MKVLLFANTDWYLFNFRRSLAVALRDAGHTVILLSPPGPYGERLRALGFRWEPAPMHRRSLNPVRELRLILWLRSLVAREQVDLVHGFTIKCAVYGSLAARLAGAPARVAAIAGLGYVFTNEGTMARVLRPLVSSLMRLALGGSNSRLILQNRDDAALFAGANLVRQEQVRLIAGSGVDCRRFAPSTAALPRGRFRVLLAARLLWDKGVSEYVEAARTLQAKGYPIDFLLAGDPDQGNPSAVPEEDVRRWMADGLIEWLGHVDDMPALLHSVQAAVLPSYREGLPKGLIEAAACGLPLVTTDVPGCRQVVTHEREGLLVPVRDPVALAGAIERLYLDQSLCSMLGDAARRRALAEFDEDLVVARTLDVYAELLPGSVQSAA